MDTMKGSGGTPMETVFYLPEVPFSDPTALSLIPEEGAHTPPPEEPSVPFHPDPAQRIIALEVEPCVHYLVFQVGALLKLAESREGCEMRWDEWEDCAIIPPLGPECEGVWVSGCRLFSVHRNEDNSGAYIQVYDFSVRGLAKHLSKQVDGTRGSTTTSSKLEAAFQSGARYLSPMEVRAQIPLDVARHQDIGYDNLSFPRVSVPISCSFGGEAK